MPTKAQILAEMANKDAEIERLNGVISLSEATIKRLQPLVTDLEAEVIALTEHSDDLQERLTAQITYNNKLDLIRDELREHIAELEHDVEMARDNLAHSDREIAVMHRIFDAIGQSRKDSVSHASRTLPARFAAYQQAMIKT